MGDLSSSREEKGPSLLDGLMRRLRGITTTNESDNGRLKETLEDLLEEESDETRAQLTAEERELLSNALSFSKLRADDLMVPRSDINAVELHADLDSVVGVFRDCGHSRLLVYRHNLDEVVGFVHVLDLLPFWGDGETFRLHEVMRNVVVVPPSMRVLDLLLEMRDTRTHMAAVVDEFGGTDGLVTAENLVVEIFGEMHHEHAESSATQLIDTGDGGFEADGRLDIEELEERLGTTLLEGDDRDEVDTLAGAIVTLVDRVPLAGERVVHPKGCVFEILDADPRRIKRVRIVPGPALSDLTPPSQSVSGQSVSGQSVSGQSVSGQAFSGQALTGGTASPPSDKSD